MQFEIFSNDGSTPNQFHTSFAFDGGAFATPDVIDPNAFVNVTATSFEQPFGDLEEFAALWQSNVRSVSRSLDIFFVGP